MANHIRTRARREFTQYTCEECGATNDTHKSKPGHHQFDPACINCGASALRRELVPELSELIAKGVPSTPAADYWAVEIDGQTQTEWAEKRGVKQASVSENIDTVEEILNQENPETATDSNASETP